MGREEGKLRHRPGWGWLLIGVVVLALAIFGGMIPCAAQMVIMSEAQEVELGKKMDEQLQQQIGFCGSPELVSYINQIGQKIAAQAEPRGFRYTFKILDDESINALALPGGYIYVTRGLLAVANDEAELAGVIGHEVGHASSRHAARQVTKATLFQLLSLGVLGAAAATPGAREHMDAWFAFSNEFFTQILLGYGRENELEADEKGVRYAFRAGYDPRCVPLFLRYLRMKEQLSGINFQGFRLTHPETTERIIKAETLAFVLARGSENKLEVGANRYRSRLEGLPYGNKDDRRFLKAYVTSTGDSLTSISRALYGDESRSREIAFLNRIKEDQILQEGTVLKVPSR
ncbi:MAG: M48 family metalloprotease [candidate division NC10 bacterium]|nr:M48 family metalloprotease [candidate division NC10 bacterium]